MTDRVGQVWMARVGVEDFPFVVIEQQDSVWLVQNLSRVGESQSLMTIKSSQLGIEEGVFTEFENRGKGIQCGTLLYLTSSILKERIA